MPRKNKTPHVRRISPGTRMFLLTIYLPWLLSMIPYSYWASTCSADLPSYSAFMVSVRQASDLPPASFRFPVTQDTLALGYILPAVGRIRDFHPLKHAPAGRTMVDTICMIQMVSYFYDARCNDTLQPYADYQSPCHCDSQ